MAHAFKFAVLLCLLMGPAARSQAPATAPTTVPALAAAPKGFLFRLGPSPVFDIDGALGDLALGAGRIALTEDRPDGRVRASRLEPPEVIADLAPPRLRQPAARSAARHQNLAHVLFGGADVLLVGSPPLQPPALLLYDLKTRQPLRTIQPAGQSAPLHRFVASGDGRRIATAAERIEIWDASTGQRLADLAASAPPEAGPGMPSPVQPGIRIPVGLSISRDGGRLLCVRADGAMAMWDLQTMQPINLAEVQGLPGRVVSAVLLADGRHLLALPRLAAPDEPPLRLFDIDTRRELPWPAARAPEADPAPRPQRVSQLIPAADVARVATTESDRTLVWEVGPDGTVRVVREFAVAQWRVARLSPDGKTFAAAAPNGRLQVWSVDTGHDVLPVPPHERSIEAVAGSDDGGEIITLSRDAVARWHAPSGRLLATHRADGVPIFVGDRDAARPLFRQVHGNLRVARPDLLAEVERMPVTPATPPAPATTRVAPTRDRPWTEPGARPGGPPGAQDPPRDVFPQVAPPGILANRLSVSPDRSLLAFVSGGMISVWSTSQQDAPLQTLNTPDRTRFSSVAFSPGGTTLVAGGHGGWALYDVHAWTPLVSSWKGGPWSADGMAFSPDGRFVACGGGTILGLWDVVQAFGGRSGPVWRIEAANTRTVSFSASGELLIAGTSRGVVVAEAATGQVLTTLAHRGGGASSAAFLPGDRRIVAAGLTPAAVVWDLPEALKDPEQDKATETDLLARLQDGEARVAYAAGLALLQRGRLPDAQSTTRPTTGAAEPEQATDPNSPAGLMAQLSSPDRAARERAHKALERLGPAARDAILDGLRTAPAGGELRDRLTSLVRLIGAPEPAPTTRTAAPDPEAVARLRHHRLRQLKAWAEAPSPR